ncbi:hypothetical protein, partial [Paraburkholderia bannensis]|uniref:hypothetical protein n=1 Tax=Paraburkholderia bannensis TaxID=765414 RepID=UPI002AC342A2
IKETYWGSCIEKTGARAHQRHARDTLISVSAYRYTQMTKQGTYAMNLRNDDATMRTMRTMRIDLARAFKSKLKWARRNAWRCDRAFFRECLEANAITIISRRESLQFRGGLAAESL